ncbi:MAG: papain fold toxin domain-containing protein [Nostoc sp.]
MVLQDIRDIVSNHPNERCVECAAEIEAYLREKGIRGERLILDAVKIVKEDSNIYDDSHPPKAEEDGYIISTNGHHEGIVIKINGEEKVFDNHRPDGLERQQWMNNLTYHSKVFGQSDFRKSGYLFP